MKKRWFAVVITAAGIGVACSSFSGDADEATQADGGTGDGVSADDGGVLPLHDGGVSPDAAPATFCANVDASFCWSFDEGPDPLRGPALALADLPQPVLTDAAASAPYAMEARLFPDSGGVNAIATLDTLGPVQRLTCELDALVTDVPANAPSSADIFRAAIFAHPRIRANRDTGGNLRLYVGGPGFTADAPIGNVVPNAWFHIRVDVKTTDGGIAGTAQLDNGTPALVTKIDDAGTLGRLSHIGFGVASFENGWTVREDNLVCRWE